VAGADPEIVHIDRLLSGERCLDDYRMLVLPGGFSYGDDLGAGRLQAATLRARLGEALHRFVDLGRPVLGICNGFQALVATGLLPGADHPRVSLTRNTSGRFECRWVWLEPDPSSPCVFTRGHVARILCPVAHGEGRLVVRDAADIPQISALAALRYVDPDGGEAVYPHDPNGSIDHIAGITNPAGTVLGLMPHPEDHITPRQHPLRHRGWSGHSGLPLFVGGVRYAAQVG